MNWHGVLTAMLPEHLLLGGIVALLLLEIADARTRGAFAFALAAVSAAAAAALWLHSSGYAAAPFPGHYAVGPAASLAKFLLLALAVPVLLLSRDEFTESRYFALLLSSLYGACLLVSSTSFMTLFLGLEILSLPVYALVLIGSERAQGAEAALKYLVLGGAATATFLMGTSFLYGATGTLGIDAIGIARFTTDPIAATGAALIISALFLKAAIVPMHAWAPDAYEAASVPVTAYMAVIIKSAVLLAALQLFGTTPVPPQATTLVALLPLASMVWGNIAAIRQQSFRRLIAYSSIAHAGYLYFAFLGAGPGRTQTIMFYLAAYGLMTLLAFTALPGRGDDAARDKLQSFRGLFHRRPYAALGIAAAMLSLAGLPPMPGFIAKFLVFRNVVAAGHTGWAVFGLLASYLGLYLYLRVIQIMFMQSPEGAVQPAQQRRLAWIAAAICVVPAILIAIAPGWLLDRL
ncbi:MAG TPA: NADH-quinone oxidoreductase subunit N [Steroidobacteraceae bacterium]|nr:NADH-quinone oxidoreductase subunit N [Steroidobacteraceae bacterium]